MNKVFVIIVTYNGLHWLQECLGSVLNSTLEVSVIIVDNASTDNTVPFIKESFKNVQVLEQTKNLGFGAANNIGISYAMKQGTDHIFLLNQDAYVTASTIETLVELAYENPEYGILSPIHTNGRGTALDQSFLYYITNGFGSTFISDFVLNNLKQPIYTVPMVNAAAWLLPKATIDIVGGFDPMFFLYGEDDNYCQRVNYHKLKIGIASNAYIKHDTKNNNSKDLAVGSEKYYTVFLNQMKVVYGNVNNNKYKKVKKRRFAFLRKSIICLISLNIEAYKVNLKKWNMLRNLDLRSSVLLNRKKGRKYL